jgi:hypothetical protein
MSEATPALSMAGTLSQLDGCALLLLQGVEEAVDIHVPSSAGSDLPITVSQAAGYVRVDPMSNQEHVVITLYSTHLQVSIVLRCDKCEEQQESGTEPLKRVRSRKGTTSTMQDTRDT